MLSMNKAPIFKQLIIKVLIPVILALLVFAGYSIYHTRDLLLESNKELNQSLYEEIRNDLEFQDQALGVIEENLNQRIKTLSNELVYSYFQNTDSIHKEDLTAIQQKLGMDPLTEDIYIVCREGVIVNTTFEKDLNFNLFTLGEDLKKYLLSIFDNNKLVIDAFSIENSTNKIKKYSYTSTLDGKYLIELGIYSDKAGEIVDMVRKRINTIASKKASIRSVDLFIGEDNPVSFNHGAGIREDHKEIFKKVIQTKQSYTVNDHEEGKDMQYAYTYLDRNTTGLYSSAVIRIVFDRSVEKAIINREMYIFFLITLCTVIILSILIFFITKSITAPLHILVDNVNKISEGNLDERVQVEGSQEIIRLNSQFNNMMAKLKEFYDELEQKVIERTAEISLQKEEIEAQRDQIENQRDVLVENNTNLLKAYEKIEHQNKRITDSIHYAKRIQTAILPTDEQLSKIAGNHFVLYKPKDIVSGDFYWASEKNGYSIIAAADCTGHGVPGAFMSMIGNTVLNKIVNEQGITDPGQILSSLRDEVIMALKQSSDDSTTKDGMDIVICAINYNDKVLYFAGANNPLYFIRDGELYITKGDKMPVGYFIGEDRDFTSHKFEFKANDVVYLFTDGYQDQFGGEKDRKFMASNFQKLLLKIHKEKMDRQEKVLDETIQKWMGKTKQLDDILVIGINLS